MKVLKTSVRVKLMKKLEQQTRYVVESSCG